MRSKRSPGRCGKAAPAVLTLLSFGVSAFVHGPAAEPAAPECKTPGFGLNLVSFRDLGAAGGTMWRDAVREIRDLGFCHVSVTPIRFVNRETGAIAAGSPRAPQLAHVAAAVAEAKASGLTVTVNPFVETEGFAIWRGEYNPPPGSAAAKQFWSDYRAYLLAVAEMAETNQADFLIVGSELRAITRESGHHDDLQGLITAVDAVFSRRLGYAANFDEFEDENLTRAVWEHPAIDFLGIDAYFPLASEAQSDASGPYPDWRFISLVTARWNEIFDARIVPFARARKAGAGMPIVLTEAGLIPYNRTTVEPSSDRFARSQPADADEQINGYRALVDAVKKRQGPLLAVHVWHWGMPGSERSAWSLGDGIARLLAQFVARAASPN